MWKFPSWEMCLGAPLGCPHFHAGSNTWNRNKSSQRKVERDSQCFLHHGVCLQGRAERASILVPGDQINRKEKSTFSLILWETPCLPLTQGQGRPWRGQSSHAASPGPHSRLMAAVCSPCHAQSPPGSEGGGSSRASDGHSFFQSARGGLGPGTHLILTEYVEGTDL